MYIFLRKTVKISETLMVILAGTIVPLLSVLIFTARVRTYDGRLCFHRCVSVHEGGVPGLRFLGGVPGLRFSGGGSQVSDFWGGVPGLRFPGGGGVTWSQ